MIDSVVTREEELLELLGIPWNGWGYEHDDFMQYNLELLANGIPVFNSFEEYLESRVVWKKRMAA